MVIRHSKLDSNVASLSGGGLYANASSSLKAFDSIVRNNSALSENGGGMYMIIHTANGNPSALL